MSSATLATARAVAWRSTHNYFTNPALILPSLVFPLFFFAAFAGGLSAIGDVPGFDFPAGYTAFQFVFVLLQSAAFAGVFAGFGIARDFENGFARRLMLAARRREAIVLGYAASALLRALFTMLVITVVGLLVGMQVGGDGGRAGRHVRARDRCQRRRDALGDRGGDAPAQPPGRTGDPDAGLLRALPGAGLRPPRPALGLGGGGRLGQPDDRAARHGPRPDRRDRGRAARRHRHRRRTDCGLRGLGGARVAKRRGRRSLKPQSPA
ncbi:MAG: ABC transporter permease [Solirubrobacterales bacterium]|nr:ABC transporter permease [Solirubrobacterales bacterium]